MNNPLRAAMNVSDPLFYMRQWARQVAGEDNPYLVIPGHEGIFVVLIVTAPFRYHLLVNRENLTSGQIGDALLSVHLGIEGRSVHWLG